MNLVEAAILKFSGEEPLRLTKIDWFLKYLQAILGLIFGVFFAFCGVAIILVELRIV